MFTGSQVNIHVLSNKSEEASLQSGPCFLEKKYIWLPQWVMQQSIYKKLV
jgi:hypothetical protein